MELLKLSDLQISLIIIGIIIIAGVMAFNWVQQARYRRKVQKAFDHEHEDVLFEADKRISSRNERNALRFNKSIIINAGTMVSNWLQQIQSRYRRKIQESFDHDHEQEDVLFGANKGIKGSERIEPQLKRNIIPELKDALDSPDLSAKAKTTKNTRAAKTQTTDLAESKIDENINVTNYVATIRSDTLISNAQLLELLQQKLDFGKPLLWLGQSQTGGSWEEITLKSNSNRDGYICVQGCLQLADRAGPVSEVNLSKFRDLIQDFAAQANAVADCPDIAAVYEQAISLDEFCANVDVMIGINIISKDDGAFIGTKIRALAEASGFKMGPEGIFKYHDDNNVVLFSLSNYESVPFLPESMKSLTTRGITFLLDVPRVTNGERVFDQMTHIARIFSNTLGGIIVDDNRIPLSDNGIIRSKQQLTQIQREMKAHNIPAGSNRAMKLFI
ncbi:MAG: cell division protein ZipA C-terminal FtsZ-binding domain-containing protein [Nitrosomonas sp.]|nr:cell division protein ZipA C-terminal FtsZ-binding domain-containing protein [Nitrosomonas sp.]MDP1950486.1 cell division protein ZipA C-terminal FtsZ-binding domain-containing protein [Nitrosomonas sp.]